MQALLSRVIFAKNASINGALYLRNNRGQCDWGLNAENPNPGKVREKTPIAKVSQEEPGPNQLVVSTDSKVVTEKKEVT